MLNYLLTCISIIYLDLHLCIALTPPYLSNARKSFNHSLGGSTVRALTGERDTGRDRGTDSDSVRLYILRIMRFKGNGIQILGLGLHSDHLALTG